MSEGRHVELLMEDGSWEPGTLHDQDPDFPGAALIEWRGITAWFYRSRGSGRTNEWREAAHA